jgi:hypothetical protein
VDAAWPVAALIAASVSAQETINADDQPSRVIFNANRRLLSLPRRFHPRKPTCREALAHPIHALREGTNTGVGASIELKIAPTLF